MASAAFLSEVTGKDGVSPDRLSGVLRITKSELAAAAGLSGNAVSQSSRSGSLSPQTRLREMSEIISRLIPWAGSELAAFAWHRSQPERAARPQANERCAARGTCVRDLPIHPLADRSAAFGALWATVPCRHVHICSPDGSASGSSPP